jgi:hypothetical protein
MSAPAIRIYDQVAVVIVFSGEAVELATLARGPLRFAHRLGELRRTVTGGSA